MNGGQNQGAIKIIRKHHSKGRIVALGLGIVIIISAVSGFIAYRHDLPALKVGDISISKSEYKVLISEAKKDGRTEVQAKQSLIDINKRIYAAKKTNLAISSSDITQGITLKYSTLKNAPNEWQTLVGKDIAITNQLLFAKQGGYEGAVLNFPFSLHFAQTYATPLEAKFNDPATIASDKAYAKKEVDYYRQLLTSNKISTIDAVKKLHQDTQLIYGVANNGSQEVRVNGDGQILLNGSNSFQSISPKVLSVFKSLKKGETSQVLTEQMKLPQAKYGGSKPVDVAYNLVKLNNSFVGNQNIESQFNAAQKGAKVISHV